MATSNYLQLYQGYYAGGLPTVLDASPFDVAQDLSTGRLWQYTGTAWVSPSWSSAVTFWLGAGTSVCDRLASESTVIPESLKVYIGTADQVPAALALSADDLAVNHDLGNYNIQIKVFRSDATSDTIVDVPFPEGSIISTEDGDWTIFKGFNTYVGFDYATVSLIWTNNGGGSFPSVIDYTTEQGAQTVINSIIATGGYTKIALKPFGFTLASMSESADGLSIDIPGFVFMVMNDDTGVTFCNIEHNSDGGSTIVFTEESVDYAVPGSFTAYAFVNSDGTSIPLLSKTNL